MMSKELPCPQCGQDMHISARYNAENIAALSDALDALVERAERVQEGEPWDLAEFILRKKKEVDDTFLRTP